MKIDKIYLASKSPRRSELLGRMNILFEVIPADVDESVSGAPRECVAALAERKAEKGAEKICEGWVLAADTLVFLGGQSLGKPKNAEQARRMLHSLSGRTHEVLTGMCLLEKQSGRKLCCVDAAYITFDELTDSEIEDYIASGEPMDKAGAYGIQGTGGRFIRHIEGDYYATVGLSLCSLRRMLAEAEKDTE